MAVLSYMTLRSPLGELALVWEAREEGAKIHRVFLPSQEVPVAELVQMAFEGAGPLSCPVVAELGKRIQRTLQGENIPFELNMIAWESCSEFQRRVLVADHRIPRGWVSTYGRIAKHLGIPNGARAVGRALATNPFPILIPCHRAISANGGLGGFQGGAGMKRALLEMEGIRFASDDRAIFPRIYY